MSQFNITCDESNTDRLIKLTGVVQDANTKETLPFANIYLTQNNSVGTAANENGEFSIEVPYGSTLTVSYAGYYPSKFDVIQAYKQVFLVPDDQLDTVYLEGENKNKKSYGWLWLLGLGGLAIAVASSDQKQPKTKTPIKARI